MAKIKYRETIKSSQGKEKRKKVIYKGYLMNFQQKLCRTERSGMIFTMMKRKYLLLRILSKVLILFQGRMTPFLSWFCIHQCWNLCFLCFGRRRLLRVPWTARRSNQSILKEISPGISLTFASHCFCSKSILAMHNCLPWEKLAPLPKC